jgi:nucleotide-binding universal stress UspA family protein
MRTFLIPVPRQPSAQKIKEYLSMVAKPGVDKLYILHVISIPPFIDVTGIAIASTDQMMQEMQREVEVELSELGRHLKQAGYQVETYCPVGFFDQEFIRLAHELAPSYVIMLTHGTHSWVENLIGSNASHVFNKLTTPVFIIPDQTNVTSFKKAEVAVELEMEHIDMFNDLMTLSEDLKMELNFVKIDKDLQLDVITNESVLNKLQHEYPGKIEYITHRKAKDPAKGLEQYAEESNSDLIVLFTGRRNFIENLFHKSVTKSLVMHSHVPLLIYHYEEK